MIRNYIKIAWRNLWKNKRLTALNVVGLAIGMAGALIIMLWLHNMLTMDRYHEKIDRLYSINNRDEQTGEIWAWNTTPKILGPSLAEELPQIEAYTRYDYNYTYLHTFEDKKIISRTSIIDSGFFKMFNFPVLRGSLKQIFEDPNSIVLTESYAKSLFGDQDPVGKIIKIDSIQQVTVKAILKDLPTNTQFKFNSLMSWSYNQKIGFYDKNWTNNTIHTFILLKKNISLSTFNEKIKFFARDKINLSNNGINSTVELFAFPFKDTYLYNDGTGGNYTSGRIDLVKLFAWIGLFILVVACINFTNLSTAKSETRAKEVGVRKTIGAGKKQLILQFLTESMIISFMAVLIAIVIVQLSLPFFNELVEKNLSLALVDIQMWIFLLLFTLFTGFISGIYPAFFLSSFKPINTLKGKFVHTKSAFSLRSVLVVTQFSLAIILIISTIIVSKQIQYTKARTRGYNENGLVYSMIQGDIDKNYMLIRNELLSSKAIVSISKNMSPIADSYSNGWGYTSRFSTNDDKKISYNRFSTDANAVQNLGLTLVQGRDIDIYKYRTDSNSVLLSESASKKLHLKNPIGETVTGDGKNFTVVGVIKDFIQNSPYDNFKPMIIAGPSSWFTTIHYRLNPNRDVTDNMKTIESIFKKFNPDYPFEYEFIDKRFESYFKETKAVGTLSMLFAGLTIFISCLGLLALIAYIIESKTKEIAIRKVLGASFVQLGAILSLRFFKLLLLSIFIATPIAWWAMNNWLQKYSYRIDIQWYYFAIAGLMAIVISMLTISFQAIKAARANPVDSLRNE